MKVSTFKPNLPDKVANVLAGTVTMTLRAYMDERGHFLQLRKNENVFGGGRIDFKRDRCDLTVDAFNTALLEAQDTKVEAEAEKPKARKKARKKAEPKPEVEAETETEVVEEPDAAEEKPKRRVRKAKPATEEEPPFDAEETAEPEAVEEKPKRRTRKRRVVEE